MRIKTDGTHEYRLDLLRRVMQRTGEGTKSGAFDFATEYTLQILDAIDEASQHREGVLGGEVERAGFRALASLLHDAPE